MKARSERTTTSASAERQLKGFVLGYGPTVRPSDCIVSLAAGASGLNLCFLQGAQLADPKKVLLGAGNQTRFVRLPSADYLARPEIETFLSAAIAQARTPFSAGAPGALTIRSVSARQRPRRRDAATPRRRDA
jgi:hypothetical protein